MPQFEANFRITLPRGIKTTERSLADLTFKVSQSQLKAIRVRPVIAGDVISYLEVNMMYSDPSLIPMYLPGNGAEQGIYVGGCEGGLSAPYQASGLISEFLYWLAAATLQAHVYWDLGADLARCVSHFVWKMPDGKVVPAAPPSYPVRAHVQLKDTGEHPVTSADWERAQKLFDGSPSPLPLWRVILADAHRERIRDIRKAVVFCAIALDVAGQLVVPKGRAFNMEVLKSGALNMKGSEPTLYATLRRLWYTRHGIVHAGETMLYEKNPQSGAKPLGPLMPEEVHKFLLAVPKAIDFFKRAYPSVNGL